MRTHQGILCILVLLVPVLAWAVDEASVRELERQCEVAREAKIKPLREAEVQRCISEQKRDADYCNRYWSDYGNAQKLPNGRFVPRKFDDLPECVAAQDARRTLTRG